ncbi:MAG TPA: c-type cytochrome [Thermoanaerobaculia bacterium]|nr:c-type cytochrome [Thermoanaerobaculia bacterium]
MKTFLKAVGLLLLIVAALAAIGVSWLTLRKPAQRAASAVKVQPTPERVARGAYLVRHVGICFDCHSERVVAYGLPFKPGREGVNGFVWDEKSHFPGVLAASNITPDRETGLGAWTDGEIIRAIREGVDREGNALFPIMPYGHLRHLSDDDAQAIVAYLRTLKPQRYEEPKKSLELPLNFVEKFIPQPLESTVPPPDRSNSVAYGKYLVSVASCAECHTPKDERNQAIAGMEFSGGYEMHTPFFKVTTANITPHPSNWMGKATKEEFIGRFRALGNLDAATAPQAADGRNTLMPWISFAGMTDQDLGAIYDYLKIVKPIEKQVKPWG